MFITLLTTGAQLLYKPGMDMLVLSPLLSLPFRILTNWLLVGGLSLYVLGAFLMIHSFRGGEVSTLYPIFSTSYVWVALASWAFLGESLPIVKLGGILIIIAGVTLLAMGSKKNKSSMGRSVTV